MSDKKTCGCGHKHDGLECAGPEAARRHIVSEIDNGHWAVMGILPEGASPYHTFSVGLFENFDRPEIIIFGVHPQVATQIINDIGDRIVEGLELESGRVYDDIFSNQLGAVFIPVEKDAYDAHMGSAIWYYQGRDFPVMQLVWPDPNGKFPWEEGFDRRYAAAQPLLGQMPDNAADLHGRVASPEDADEAPPANDA